MTAEKFEKIRAAMREQFKMIMPKNFDIYFLAEYDPRRFTDPELIKDFERRPNCKYIAILACPMKSVSAIGESVAESIAAAIMKIENMTGKPQ